MSSGRGSTPTKRRRSTRSRLLHAVVGAAVFSVSVISGLIVATESARACNGVKEQVFAAAWNGSTSTWRMNANGTKNKILLKERDICGPSTKESKHVWSMSHLRMGGATGNWVEVGWFKEQSLTSNKFLWFSEWGLNYSPIGGTAGGHPCPSVGTYDWWRTANDAGTTTWKLSVNCSNDQYAGTWQLLDTITGTG